MKSVVPFSCWLLVLLPIGATVAWLLRTNSQPPRPSRRSSSSRQTQPLSVSPSEFGAFNTNADDLKSHPVSPSLPPEPLPLRELYPVSVARENGTIQVDSIHTLYYEIHGSPNTNNDGGNGGGRSALFLHGGPGAGCSPTHARFFDPALYDTIVLFDQRGCGRSTPRGQVINNTLLHLLEDCERLRELVLGKDGVWHTVLGGSWGSTLAIAYAQEYPERVKSLILRGVCLLRPPEVDWLFTPQGGAAKKNPQAWQAFAEAVGKKGDTSTNGDANANVDSTIGAETIGGIDRTVMLEYYDYMFSANATKRWMAARGWMSWEFTVSSSYKQQQQAQVEGQPASSTNPDSPAVLVSYSYPGGLAYQDRYGRVLEQEETNNLALDSVEIMAERHLRQGLPVAQSTDETTQQPLTPRPIGMNLQDFEKAQEEQFGNFSGLPALPMLTCYYSVNDRFVINGWDLLESSRMERIQYLPCIAVQGGRDPICPPDTALDVKQKWPGMELRIPLNAGHSMYHPELVHELVQATDRIGRFVT